MALAWGQRIFNRVGFREDPEDGQILFRQGSRRVPGFALLPKRDGVITLQAATTGGDIDFADMKFAKNELSSHGVIKVYVWGLNNDSTGGGPSINISLKFTGGAATPASTAFNIPGSAATRKGTAEFTITQVPTDTSLLNIMRIGMQSAAGTTVQAQLDTKETSTDDFFSIAWTLRINVEYSATANADSDIFYIVERHHD